MITYRTLNKNNADQTTSDNLNHTEIEFSKKLFNITQNYQLPKTKSCKDVIININKNSNRSSSLKNLLSPSKNSSDTTPKKYHTHSNSKSQKEKKNENKKNSYNILVAVRCRPLTLKEKQISEKETIKIINNKIISIKDPNYFLSSNNIRSKKQNLEFDFAFSNKASQEIIFNKTTKFLIDNVLNGYNATVFAYGATGAGKTYTMLGDDENPGIMFNTLKELFNKMIKNNEKNFYIKLCYLEIYNENIRDLLNINNNNNLELREDPIKGIFINNITEIELKSIEQIKNLLNKGNKNRTTEETEINITSSRSHAILQILIYKKNKIGKLSLIDLAGSERANYTNNKGMRLIEGGKINKSLLALGNCINALCEANEKKINKLHIPYRDSKLTRLLKDSLGGNSRTVMIANVSPFIYCFDETYNTLKYANRAKHIKNKVSKNFLNEQLNSKKYLSIIKNLQSKINILQKQINLINVNNNNNKKEFSEKEKINELLTNENNEKNYNNTSNNIESDTENDNLLESFNNENKIESIIGDYIQQSKAEVKLKKKIMGIQYDIFLLNNIIKHNESKGINITDEKTKLKSLKKILEKNNICLSEITKKNEIILQKYLDNLKIVNFLESESFDEKYELTEFQKRFMYIVHKMTNFQKENIDLKYSNAIYKENINIKNKYILDLEKQIELRDLMIKDKTISSDDNNYILNKDQQNIYKSLHQLKYDYLISENINKSIFVLTDTNDNKENINGLNIGLKSKKTYSFKPRGTSLANKNKVKGSSQEKNKNLNRSNNNILIQENSDNKTIKLNNSYMNPELYKKNNKINNNQNSQDYININDLNFSLKEINDNTKNNDKSLPKKCDAKNSMSTIETNVVSQNYFQNNKQNKNAKIYDEEFIEDSNNKSLRSMLNDIELMNSNINLKLNIIEKTNSLSKANIFNKNNISSKLIARTMENAENTISYLQENNNNTYDKDDIEININHSNHEKEKKQEKKIKIQLNKNLITGNSTINSKRVVAQQNIIFVNRNFKNHNPKNAYINYNNNANTSKSKNKKNSFQENKSLFLKSQTLNNNQNTLLYSSSKNINNSNSCYLNINNSVSQRNKSILGNKSLNIEKENIKNNVRDNYCKKKTQSQNIINTEKSCRNNSLINKAKDKKVRMDLLIGEAKKIYSNKKNETSKKFKESNSIEKINIGMNESKGNNKEKEKEKIQQFYSEHLNKYKNTNESFNMYKIVKKSEGLKREKRNEVNDDNDKIMHGSFKNLMNKGNDNKINNDKNSSNKEKIGNNKSSMRRIVTSAGKKKK